MRRTRLLLCALLLLGLSGCPEKKQTDQPTGAPKAEPGGSPASSPASPGAPSN